MKLKGPPSGSSNQTGGERGGKNHYSRLYRKFVFLTLICSLAPLFLVGWGIYIYYSGFSRMKIESYFKSQVDHHRGMIELFLRERTSDLQLVVFTHSPDYLQKPPNLRRIFNVMNREGCFFTDLGIIDDQGRHLAYIGPYDLMGKNYSKTFWFKEVMKKGVYISDMFMGFRNAPHFIIAVLRAEGNRKWILRASIDTEYFRSLVENVKMGRTGEAYLSNREGILQTTPRFSGKIMEKAPLPAAFFHKESGIGILETDRDDPNQQFPRQIVAYTWLENPRWKLVIKQDYSEAFRDVNHANRAALIFLHLSLLVILIISVISTRYMIKVIKKRDEEADRLNKQLTQAGKLASLGELSAGVAHEINNPLAIILTENQVIRDSIEETPTLDESFKTELFTSLSQVDAQVQRCNLITQNLLRFSRRTGSRLETVNLNAFLEEIIQLMEGRAKGMGIQFSADLEKDIPSFLSDPSQLQQVFLNLITNAFDAHDGKPYGTVSISTRSNNQREGVEIVVADTGSGISPENMEKMFDPFFTTKPVGKGTGLGLSITYSIIKRLGGDISVQSEIGKGTQFNIFLPFMPPADVQENLDDVFVNPPSSA
ncbi:MAG: two-component sensor histidine kinase [Desulfobacterales bacterium]|nr:two-component sensor histidine kinase [Desulfobacterales bacterium]